MIDCNEWRTEKRHECTNMGKVKRLELWWQLYRTSLPVWNLENFRPMYFCWHECTVTQWMIDCMVQNISWKMAVNGHVKLRTPSPFPFHKIQTFNSVVLSFRPIIHTIFPKLISKLHSSALKSVLCSEVKYNSKDFPVLRVMKAYGGVKVRLHLFVGGSECLASLFGR